MNRAIHRALDAGWKRILLASAMCLLLFFAVIAATGADPVLAAQDLVRGAWGSKAGLAETVVRAIPVMFCAFAAALPGRVGLINIGGEGQFLFGAMAATGIVLHAGESPLILGWMALAAFVAGGLWGVLPGALRAFTRASETVVSLLMNYVAALLLLHLIHGPWKDPASQGWAQSQTFPPSAVLPQIGTSRVHVLVFAGILIALALKVLFDRSSVGLCAKILATQPRAARYAGVSATRYYVMAFAVGGGIAALAGFGDASAIHGRLREGMSLGYGYAGFLVAWLCSNRFELIPVASLFIGGLIVAADVLQVSAGLPFATINLLQGLLLLTVLMFDAVGKRIREDSKSDSGPEPVADSLAPRPVPPCPGGSE